MSLFYFPILLLFPGKQTPVWHCHLCLEKQHVWLPGDSPLAEKARTKIHVQPQICGMLIHSDKEASGPLLLHQSCRRLTESQITKTTRNHHHHNKKKCPHNNAHCWPTVTTPWVHLTSSATIPGWNVGCEWDTVIWKRQRSGACDVLPLCRWSTSYVNINHEDFLLEVKHRLHRNISILSYFASHSKKQFR